MTEAEDDSVVAGYYLRPAKWTPWFDYGARVECSLKMV